MYVVVGKRAVIPIPESQQNKLGIISHQPGQKSRPRMLLGENFSLDLTYMIATENAL